jgi:hypothetical protein
VNGGKSPTCLQLAKAPTNTTHWCDVADYRRLWSNSNIVGNRGIGGCSNSNGQATPLLFKGEASPSYMLLPEIPFLVRAILPHAKFVVMLRNPVDRALVEISI